MSDAMCFVRAALLIAGMGALPAASAQVLYSQDFQDGGVDPVSGEPRLLCSGSGGAGTYPFAPGWLLRNVDNRTPDPQVAYVNDAWEVREDFGQDINNCVAFSTSYYAPVGQADDWMWTPAIGPLPAGTTRLSWRARAYDPNYRDGYEVRIMTMAPTGGTGVIGNQLSASTQLFSVANENAAWTSRTVDLSSWAGQTVHIGFRNPSNDQFLLVVDDVKVETVRAFDPTLSAIIDVGTSRGYSRVPAPFGYPFALDARIGNAGLNALGDVRVDADLLVEGVPVDALATTPLPTLASGATQTVPLGSGVYDTPGAWSVEGLVSATEGDDDLANSVFALPLAEVTENELARAQGAATGVLGIGAGNGGELGIDFSVPGDARLEAVRAVIVNTDALPDPGDGGPVGDGVGDFNGYTLSAVVRAWDTGTNQPGAVLATATVTVPADADTGELPLEFDFEALALPPGRYLMTLVEPTSPQPVTLALQTMRQRFTPGSSWVIWPASGGWKNTESFGANFELTFALTAVLRVARNVPVAVDDAFAVPKSGAFTGSVAGNDTPSDQGGHVWSVTVPPASGALTLQADGSFEYTPQLAAAGSTVTFGYQLCDADTDCSSAVVQLQIAANPMPQAADDVIPVRSDRMVSASVAGNDTPSADGGNTWSIVTSPASGTLMLQPDGTFDYTADAAAAGTTVNFAYALCDVDDDCSQATVQLQVGVNLPTAQDDAFTVSPAGAYLGDVAANDTVSQDGGNAWTLATPPATGTLELQADGQFNYTPASAAAGTTVSFGYSLCDADGDCDAATVELVVSPFGIFADSFEGTAPPE